MSGADDYPQAKNPSGDRNEKRSKSSKRPSGDAPTPTNQSASSSEPRQPAERSASSSRRREEIPRDDENRELTRNYGSTAQLSKWTETAQAQKIAERDKISNLTTSSSYQNENSRDREGGRENEKEREREKEKIRERVTKKIEPVIVPKRIEEDDDDEYADDDFDTVEEDEVSQPAIVKKTPASVQSQPLPTVSFSTLSRSQAKGTRQSDNEDLDLQLLKESVDKENATALRRKQEQLDNNAASKNDGERSEKKKSKQTQQESDPESNPQKSKSSISLSSSLINKTAQAKSKNVSKFNMKSRLSGLDLVNSMNPRARRLGRLLASNVLELTEEKIQQLYIPPSSTFDQYLRTLRAQPPSVKQTAWGSSNEECRHVEVATEEVLMKNKEVQYTHGDDTNFLNIIKAVEERREMKKSGIKITDTLLESAQKINLRNIQYEKRTLLGRKDNVDGNDDITENNGFRSKSVDERVNNSLNSFLRKSSFLCEAIMNEIAHTKNENEKINNRIQRTGNKIFSPTVIVLGENLNQNMGEEKNNVGNANSSKLHLLKNRSTISVRFSPLQPHVLVTAHVSSEQLNGNEFTHTDPLSQKGLYCVWDVSVPNVPLHVLASSGMPTSCCFSNSQPFLILAGTDEGSLHLWDIRETVNGNENRKGKGLLHPCFSTHLSLPIPSENSNAISNSKSDMNKKGTSGLNWGAGLGGQHTSAITQVESLGVTDWTVTSLLSQFASLDREGTVAIWSTSTTNNITNSDFPSYDDIKNNKLKNSDIISTRNDKLDGKFSDILIQFSRNDYGLSPKGKISLIQTKIIYRNDGITKNIFSTILNSSLINSHGKDKNKNENNNDNKNKNKIDDNDNIFSFSSTPNISVLSPVPNDTSTLLLSGNHGFVSKIVRFGEPSPPTNFCHPATGRMEINVKKKKEAYDAVDSHVEKEGFGGKINGLLMDGELKFFSPVTSISVRSTIGNNNGNKSKTVKNNLSSRSTESEINKENGEKERRGSVSDKEKSSKEREDENDIDDMGVPSVPSYDTTGMYNNVNSARRKSMENLRLKNLKMTPGEFALVAWSELFLVGREDGTVDLFQMDDPSPLITWTVNNFIPPKDKENDTKSFKNSPISLVQWCPQRPAAFFAFDETGYCYFFDLSQKIFEPLYIEYIGVKNNNGKNGKNGSGDVSKCRPGGKTVYIASNSHTKNSEKNGINVNIRILCEDLLQDARGIGETEIAAIKEENKFRKSMAKWAARVCEPQITVLLKNSYTESDHK